MNWFLNKIRFRICNSTFLTFRKSSPSDASARSPCTVWFRASYAIESSIDFKPRYNHGAIPGFRIWRENIFCHPKFISTSRRLILLVVWQPPLLNKLRVLLARLGIIWLIGCQANKWRDTQILDVTRKQIKTLYKLTSSHHLKCPFFRSSILYLAVSFNLCCLYSRRRLESLSLQM